MIEQKPTIYKAPGVYQMGGGGNSAIYLIPEEFEQVDSIYLNYNKTFLYGINTSEPNNYSRSATYIVPCNNKGIIRSVFWKKPDDHIGGNRNYVFGLNDKQTTTLSYDSDLKTGIMLQVDKMYLFNGTTRTEVANRNNYLVGGINEVIFNKNVCTVNGHSFSISYSETQFTNIYPIPQKQNGNYFDDTETNSPSVALISLEVFDENGALVVCALPVRRKADGKIGVLEVSNPTFFQNSTNDSLAIKTFA